uniref:Uncharacterized protein n=1 Tax=Anguilla anguilla TaxID=7936 RepID=A0A0E9TY73_ANGAN
MYLVKYNRAETQSPTHQVYRL